MHRRKMPAHICIIELGLGCGAEKVAVNLWWHVGVTIDGAAYKLHFERVKSVAVADGCQSVGMHRMTGNVRSNLWRFRRRGGNQSEQCGIHKTSATQHG